MFLRVRGRAIAARHLRTTAPLLPSYRAQCLRSFASGQGKPQKPTDGELDSQSKDNLENDPLGSSEQQQQSPAPPTRPLPDLRQGIPSSLAELTDSKWADKDRKADEEAEHAWGGGGGELPKSAYETSLDRRKDSFFGWMYATLALMGVSTVVYLGRNWESEEEEKAHPEAPSGFGIMQMYLRAKARLEGQVSYITEPTFPKLLPELDQRPQYTLVVGLEDLLVHSEWTREHGWRLAKRPGTDQFLRYLSYYYEIVIWSNMPAVSAEGIIAKLDPFGIAYWYLHREATRYEKGEHIKDLSYLNRDLSKVVMVDSKAAFAKGQPENAIILPPWTGDPKDRQLVSLIPFLEIVAATSEKDTRHALESYAGTDIPTEFGKRMAKKREQWKLQQQAESSTGKRAKSSNSGWLANTMGMRPQPGQESSITDDKDPFERLREPAMKNYEFLEKEIRENSDKWMKEREEAEKRMMEENAKAMKEMKTGALDWLRGKTPEEGPKDSN